jgi:hypothetical protein
MDYILTFFGPCSFSFAYALLLLFAVALLTVTGFLGSKIAM